MWKFPQPSGWLCAQKSHSTTPIKRPPSNLVPRVSLSPPPKGPPLWRWGERDPGNEVGHPQGNGNRPFNRDWPVRKVTLFQYKIAWKGITESHGDDHKPVFEWFSQFHFLFSTRLSGLVWKQSQTTYMTFLLAPKGGCGHSIGLGVAS